MANSHSLSFAHRLIVSVSLVCIFPKMTMGLVGNLLNVGYKLLFKQQTVLVTTFDGLLRKREFSCVNDDWGKRE
jgi:hypothetical protein